MKRSKLFTMIISLLAAVCLWIYVVTIVNPDGETTISNIPVTFSGQEVLREDYDLIITGDYNDMVAVHFSGKTADMKKLEEFKDEITAVVDVSKVRSTKMYSLTYDVTLPDAVSESAITISDRNPSSIQFNVEKLLAVPIPVVGDFTNVEIAEGYMLDSTSLDYEAVTVEGPESVVSTIAQARVTLDRTNVDTSIAEIVPFVLLNKDGEPVDMTHLTTNVSEIEVKMNVAMYKDVPLEVKFINGGGATDADVSYEIEPKSIMLSGDAAVLEGLNVITLDTIDLSELSSNNETVIRPILIPNDAKNVSGEEEATITLKIKNKEIGVIRATNFVFTGEPEGLEAKSLAQQLSVTLRASSEDIGKITSNNLRVVADMSEFTQAGTYQVPVTIYIDGYPDAGIIGEYTIAVSLGKIVEE